MSANSVEEKPVFNASHVSSNNAVIAESAAKDTTSSKLSISM